MKVLNVIALTLLIIGGINWGTVALFNMDMVASVFGTESTLANIVYTLIGVAALYSLYLYWPVLRGEDQLRHRDIDVGGSHIHHPMR